MPNSFVWPQVFRVQSSVSVCPALLIQAWDRFNSDPFICSLWHTHFTVRSWCADRVVLRVLSVSAGYECDMYLRFYPPPWFLLPTAGISEQLTYCMLHQPGVCGAVTSISYVSVCALVCVSAAIRDRDAEAAMTKQPEWIKQGEEMSTLTSQHRSGVDTHRSQVTTLILWIQNRVDLNLELRIPSITKSLGRVGSLPSAQLWRLLSVSSKWKRKTQDPQSTNTLDNWTACWR